ncbi:MAG: thioredoxin-disulfide reductase [Leptolyngbyaceae cyanobacterium MO_188.B28]|nr:thioredoxin-disulfide reductase [Leptolyngbyaceae cyanobacterium MO_188.B28]
MRGALISTACGLLRKRAPMMIASKSERRSVVIIGAGAAGLTAAIYAARAHLDPLVMRGPKPGGQLTTTTSVENYPGFVHGVLGPELMQYFEAQAARFGTELSYGSITEVDFSQYPFELRADNAHALIADAVIIATGATPRWLGLENERRLLGRGVSTCATCDGFFFQDQAVAVVGGGDAAMESALLLRRFASQVYVIHRRDRLRASKIMQKLALRQEKIRFIWNTQVKDVLGENEVEGILLEQIQTGETTVLPVKGMFVAIGHQPNTEIFRTWLEMDEEGYIFTHSDSTYTSVSGVFACGDAQDRIYRQAVTAAGSGCMAAIDAERWLQQEGESHE